MLVVQISGGLGNQLFQYSYACYLKKKFPMEKVFIENSFYLSQPSNLDQRNFELSKFENLEVELLDDKFFYRLKNYNTKLSKLVWYIYRILFNTSNSYFILYEDSKFIIKALSKIFKNKYLIGNWQSREIPISEHISTIKKLKLKPSSEFLKINQVWSNKIESENSIAVCIRRSDFVKFQAYSKKEFFTKSIKMFRKSFTNPFFYFFSDEINWCKQNFKNIPNTTFIDTNFKLPFEDMMLISKCRHAIISKSTFAWWGSILIKNRNKIILLDSEWKLGKYTGMKIINQNRILND